MKIFANGGGSGDRILNIYKKIDSIIDYNKPALYIPLAMEPDKHPYDGCYEWIKQEICGINVPSIKMVESFEEFAFLNYNDYSFIFIGGGNTFRLLKGLKDSGAFLKLKDYILNDGIVFGGSAGAVIMGYDVSCSMDENYVNLEDTTGLNLIDGFSIFPHYTNFKSKLTKDENEERLKTFTNRIIDYTKNDLKMIAIPEEDTITVDENGMKIIGYKPYYKFEKGKIKMIDTIKLVPYTDADYEFVYEVKKNAYKKYVEECWGSWIEEDQRKYYDKFINRVKDNAYIIMDSDNKIGFYNGEVLENGNYEVGNICIIPEYQGKGIGSKLLKDKLEENKDRDIEIQFFKQNPVGKLYERLGFVPNGETEFHYQMIKSKQVLLKK
ncbi:MAG: GNAT family N-acetyltransferase [Bacilli bacterium]|nr:GNAT family N-acetyltransferase [Bacilli bacterium]